MKLGPVVMSPSPPMWVFFKWTCMLIILDQSTYGRIFIHEEIILQIFSITVLSVEKMSIACVSFREGVYILIKKILDFVILYILYNL